MNIISENQEFIQSINDIWGADELSLSPQDIMDIYQKNNSRWSDRPYNSIADQMGRVTRLARTEYIPIFRYCGSWLLAQKYEVQFAAMERLPKWLGGKQTTFLHARVNDIPLLYGERHEWREGTMIDYSFGLHSSRHETVYGVYGGFDGIALYDFLLKVNAERKKENAWSDNSGLVPQWLAAALELEPAR